MSLDVDKNRIGNLFAAIDEQSKKLTEKLPPSLKSSVSFWIDRISLEYLSYCRRLEVLFGVSRYFLMDFITRDDWTETCRLDEMKLAERLLKDSQLTCVQRFCIACVFSLLNDIEILWNRLSKSDKINVIENLKDFMPELNFLVQMWSDRLIETGNIEPIQKKQELWSYIHRKLVLYGNVSILKSFWKELEEKLRRDTVTDMALMSLEHYKTINFEAFHKNEKLFMSNNFFRIPYNSIEFHNLPSYYSESLFYFLLEMNEDQRLVFFQKAFETEGLNVLKCFLDWPLRKYFLQTVNQLWKIIPLHEYVECLIALVSLYSASYNSTLTFEFSENYNFYYKFLNGESTKHDVWHALYDNYCISFYKKENQHYDYRSLLWRFWEETPQTYKQDLFNSQELIPFDNILNNVEFAFFTLLVKKSPFYKTDESLFKLIFNDLPEKDRVALINSNLGEHMCSVLLEKENWSLVNWLVQQCLEEDKIPGYKKQFILSESGRKLCWYTITENRENSLLGLLDWSFDLDSEKVQFKHDLFNEKILSTECGLLMCREEITKVERIMNFFLLSAELKKEFKKRCVKATIKINYLKVEKLYKVLAWCFDFEEEENKF